MKICCQLDPLEKSSIKFPSKTYIFCQQNSFENVVHEMAAILSRPQYVDSDGLGQDCSNFVANALDLLQSRIKPSI